MTMVGFLNMKMRKDRESRSAMTLSALSAKTTTTARISDHKDNDKDDSVESNHHKTRQCNASTYICSPKAGLQEP